MCSSQLNSAFAVILREKSAVKQNYLSYIIKTRKTLVLWKVDLSVTLT
jgi:hypothetical protein